MSRQNSNSFVAQGQSDYMGNMGCGVVAVWAIEAFCNMQSTEVGESSSVQIDRKAFGDCQLWRVLDAS